jgi:hypothetical protein
MLSDVRNPSEESFMLGKADFRIQDVQSLILVRRKRGKAQMSSM